MNIVFASLGVEVAAVVSSFGGGPSWNPLPSFRRDLDPATLDSAVVLRLSGNGTLDAFPDVELGGVALRNVEGLQAKFGKVHILHIRAGKIDPAVGWTGPVTVSVTDLFGTHSHTFSGPGEVTYCLEAGVIPTASSAVSVSFYGGSTNVGVEVLIAGKETA
jgi:hypothetical protein